VDALKADISRARKKLGWSPRFCFEDLVKIMVDSDLALAGVPSKGEGARILGEKGITWTSNKLTIR